MDMALVWAAPLVIRSIRPGTHVPVYASVIYLVAIMRANYGIILMLTATGDVTGLTPLQMPCIETTWAKHSHTGTGICIFQWVCQDDRVPVTRQGSAARELLYMDTTSCSVASGVACLGARVSHCRVPTGSFQSIA